MKIIKKNLLIILFSLIFLNYCYSAGTSGSDKDDTKSNYDNASYLIKSAKRLEKKNKKEKALKRYKKAIKYLLKSNKEKPNQPDTLNYLGFANRKLGNFKVAENYYLKGLEIKPNHNGINEYLGELYIQTNRVDLAKERLKVLKNCQCEEFEELNNLINNN
ncbi:tetratricopeptide repeat protein [Candidatus Pelagibacter sp.]|nr:tetratricopeptide repeat protein [Candidatus Pelagibacter sp.]